MRVIKKVQVKLTILMAILLAFSALFANSASADETTAPSTNTETATSSTVATSSSELASSEESTPPQTIDQSITLESTVESCDGPTFTGFVRNEPDAFGVTAFALYFDDANGVRLDYVGVLIIPKETWNNTPVPYTGAIPATAATVFANNTDTELTSNIITIRPNDCEVDKVVTPEAVEFIDVGDTGSYTIPSVEGVEYVVGGKVKKPGTYPWVGTVTVTARPLEGYVFPDEAVTRWSETFTPPIIITTAPTTKTTTAPDTSKPSSSAPTSVSKTSTSKSAPIDTTIPVVTLTSDTPVDTTAPVVATSDSSDPVVAPVVTTTTSAVVNATPDGVEAGPEYVPVRPVGASSTIGFLVVGAVIFLWIGGGLLVRGRKTRTKPAHL